MTIKVSFSDGKREINLRADIPSIPVRIGLAAIERQGRRQDARPAKSGFVPWRLQVPMQGRGLPPPAHHRLRGTDPLQNTLTSTPPPTVINPPATTRGVTRSNLRRNRTASARTMSGEIWYRVVTMETIPWWMAANNE